MRNEATAWTRFRRASALLAAALLANAGARAQAPTPLVSFGAAQVAYAGGPDALLVDPATFWYAPASCAGGVAGDGASAARILRGSTWGTAPREILNVNPARAANVCNPYQLVSNLAADGTSVWFVDNQGPAGQFALQRRARDANAGDPSTLVQSFGSSVSSVEVNAEFPTFLFVIVRRPGTGDVLLQISKATGEIVNFNVETGDTLRDLRFDGRYLYWVNGSALRANDTTNGARRSLDGGVTSYFPVGFRAGECSPGGCLPDVAFVYYGKGNQILLTDAVDPGGYPPQYTSTISGATIPHITRSNGDVLFFIERRPTAGGGFDREDRVFRYAGGPTPTLLYTVNNGGPGLDALTNDFTFLYYHDRVARTLLKQSLRSEGIPVADLRGGAIEVTQGIQNPENSVSLYSGRRTFVRFFPKSFGDADVRNVTASLAMSGFDGVFLGRLEPVNRVGKLLTVKRDPRRVNLDDGFLFEVPIAWTNQTTLQFVATVNPFAGVVEDVYSDNSTSSPFFVMVESPRMDLEIIDFRYRYGANLVTGGFFENFDSIDYMNRIYPLALGGGSVGDPRPGLHRNILVVQDDGMASRVDRSNDDCKPLLVLNPDGSVKSDDRNLCAGNFALAQIEAMRKAGDIPKNRYHYGAIAFDATIPRSARCPNDKGQPGDCLVRGFNPGGSTISVGPREDFGGVQQNYMAHEVGHAIGRGHPWNGADPVCKGQNASDFSFPNPLARIGNALLDSVNETADMGFDPGQAGNVSQPMQLFVASRTGDFMSYCEPYWTSAYNYAAIWTTLSFFPLAASLPRAASAPRAAAIPGDWLLAFGHFSLGRSDGAFSTVRRLDSVAEVPALMDGGFTLELRGDGGTLLSSHPFTPDAAEEAAPEVRSFALVVPFAPGTRSLRIAGEGGEALATHAVSANRPVVSDVTLVAPPDPVAGTVEVAWSATDADGDPLRFDVSYSNDAGASWRPLHLGLEGPSLALDFATLGGGTGVVRVEANDGAQSGRAESAAFPVAENPPVPRIASPAAESQTQWGQLVTFVGDALDPQAQPIPEASFVWSNPYRVLGAGRALSVTDLEVGSYDVSLQVTNAAGLSASASVPVTVGDRISYPGPRLSAVPSSISFSVEADDESVQLATLDVANVGGSGALPVTATASPEWLRVEGVPQAGANAPVALSVTADAAGLPAGQASVGQIVLTSDVTPSDTLTIPVTLVKGSAFLGVMPPDSDGDGVADASDVCILVPDPVQTDGNGDGYGNACDADFNDDGIVNFLDLVRMKQRFFQSDAVVDLTGDGLVNFADLARMKQRFLLPPGPAAGRP